MTFLRLVELTCLAVRALVQLVTVWTRPYLTHPHSQRHVVLWLKHMRNRAEQQRVFTDTYGELPLPCVHCKESVLQWGRTRDDGNVHHRDGDMGNNAPENLELLHHKCHSRHHTSQRDSEQQRRASQARWAKPRWAAAKARRDAERTRIAAESREDMIARRSASIRAAYATGEPQKKLSAVKKGVPKPPSFHARSECPGCGRMLTPSWLTKHARGQSSKCPTQPS